MTNVMDMKSTVDKIRFRMKGNEILRPFSDVLDDKFLYGFFRGKKCNVDKTIESLGFFITVRTIKYKSFMNAYRPSNIPLLGKGMYNLLKEKDPLGRRVVVIQAIFAIKSKYINLVHQDKWIPAETPFPEMVISAMFIMDEGIRTDFSEGDAEIVFIYDCAGLSFEHIKQLTPRNLILLLDMFVKSVPGRPKGMHYVNQGVLLYNIFRFVKPLLEKKISERFFMHSSNFPSLHKHIPASILPQSLGGDLTEEEAYDQNHVARVRGNDAFYDNLSNV